MKYKSIYLCNAHQIRNAGNIKQYFIENSQDFVAFHFFQGFSKKYCYFEKYRNGKLTFKREFNFYKGNNLIIKNIFYYLYFCFVLLKHVKRGSYLITNAPFFCLFNSILSQIKTIKYVLWIGDFYPQKEFPMNLYNWMVNRYNKNFKYVIYLSPTLESLYYDRKRDVKKNRYQISLGIKKQNFIKHDISKNKIIVGFIGVIRKQQGLDLFFSYLINSDNCILEIVGDGYDLEYYKKLAKSFGITDKIKFYGSVENLSPILKKWNIGIALYEKGKANLSRYAEPTKIKDYLSFGIPVITTNTTYFSKEIEEYNAGYVVAENTNSLKIAINKIIKNYNTYLDGVNKLLVKYEYISWYDNRFKFLK